MAIKYVLNYYNLGDDHGICFEHEDSDVVAQEALRRCSSDSGLYTYRMEAWKNGEKIGGWRFFQDGREFTDVLRKTCLE